MLLVEPGGVERLPLFVVDRPRLMAILDAVPPGGVGLVSAPAGAGKSVLMALWSRRGPGRCQVRLTAAHNDPAVFARDLMAAIESVAPSFDSHVSTLVAGGRSGLGREFLARVLVSLEELDGPVDIVFDDVQVLSDGALCRNLEELLTRLPANVRVLLGARWDPLPSLQHLRLEGRLVEVRMSDLAFDPRESRELIESVCDRPITDAQLDALRDRTEGWAAGLQLAAISMARTDDIGEFVRAFTGSHRLVADYLIEQVLERLEPDVRRFLLRTCVLEWLTPDLCNAVTGDDNAYEMLRLLRNRSLFLIPMEGRDDRVRYHHLFADLLRYQLRSTHPALKKDLRRAAAAWLSSHGHTADAIDQLLAAGDAPQVVELIMAAGQEFFEREEALTLERWLEAARELDLEPSVKLEINLLAAQSASHAMSEARETYCRLRRREGLEPGDAAAAEALYAGLGLDALPSSEMRRAAAEATGLLRAFPQASVIDFLGVGGRDSVEVIARAMEAVAALHDGDLTDSEDRFEALVGLPGAQYRIWRLYVLGGLAFTRGLAGRCGEAQSIATEAVLEAEANRVTHHHSLAYAYFALALSALDRNDLTEANAHLHRSAVRVQRTHHRAFVAFQRVLRTEYVSEVSGPKAALAALRLEPLAGLEPPLAVDLTAAQKLHLLVADGQLAEARSLVAASSSRSPRWTARVIDLELASGRVDAARQLVDRSLTDATDPRTAVESSLRSAAVLQAEGHDVLAAAALEHALDVAEPHGLLLPFLEQPATPGLLRHEARLASRPFARSIISASSERKARGTALQSLPDPLTDREREVLRHLPTRLSNAEIAAALYISVNTLKSHLQHIYTKLDVTTRDEAVAAADHLGLL